MRAIASGYRIPDSAESIVCNVIAANIKSFLEALWGDNKGTLPGNYTIAKRVILSAVMFKYESESVNVASKNSIKAYLNISTDVIDSSLQMLKEPIVTENSVGTEPVLPAVSGTRNEASGSASDESLIKEESDHECDYEGGNIKNIQVTNSSHDELRENAFIQNTSCTSSNNTMRPINEAITR